MAKIAAIVNDLISMTRIRNTAENVGLHVGFVGTVEQIDHYLKDCEVVLIDLENDLVDPVDLIERVKTNPATSSIRLIAYLSHVDKPLRLQALAAGCDKVLSRFEFNSNLKEILQASL